MYIFKPKPQTKNFIKYSRENEAPQRRRFHLEIYMSYYHVKTSDKPYVWKRYMEIKELIIKKSERVRNIKDVDSLN